MQSITRHADASLPQQAAREIGITPDLSTLPRNVDRRAGAELVTRFFFPVSPRSLEVWPLVWRHVNGKAVVATAELFAVAEAKLSAAPPIRGGRRPLAKAA
jgi:hypothetical protein